MKFIENGHLLKDVPFYKNILSKNKIGNEPYLFNSYMKIIKNRRYYRNNNETFTGPEILKLGLWDYELRYFGETK